ncbi:MAG: 4-alpha-glucanotransferase [Gemmatimonadota bacterium]
MKTRVRGLTELARLYGVETGYEGMGGERRRADPEALMLTLRALGAALHGAHDAPDALHARRTQLDAMGLQPVHVAWGGNLPHVRVRLTHGEAEQASLEIRLESGGVITHACQAEPANLPARRGWQATHVIRFAARLPHGYHRLQVETSGATFESLIIAAPRHAWVPEDARQWGVFFPLYALCSGHSQGIGDYSDLQRSARWVRELGGDFVSTLPLLATFLDAPFEPSPYAPASRLFWNELFVDLARVPGWTADADEFTACVVDDLIDYRRVAAVKRRALERALQSCRLDPALMSDLHAFAASSARAEDYARFRAVCDRRREGWPVWPDRLRAGELRAGDFAPEDFEYHLFAQWQADEQVGRVASDDAAASLYLDMPLGVHPDSYDAWRFQGLFADGVSAGAPPDLLFTGGQEWGFRPIDPNALRASGYAYLIETLRHHLRHARMLRLDHVMSLYRLFWVPAGVGARRGVYVRYPEDEMFAVLVLESARHRAAIVGEDLGTVPAAVRRAMDSHRVLRMHVVQFEADPDRRPPVPEPGESVVASLNTHDMPTFAGFWRGTEIDGQLDLGLIDEAGRRRALQRRAALRAAISRDIGGGGEIDMAIARQRLLERLSASPAACLLVTLEDLWLEDRPQNVPGTSYERPNWRRRLARPLEDIIGDAAVRRMLNAIGERRRAPHHLLTKAHG